MLVILLMGSLIGPGQAQTAAQPVPATQDQWELDAPLDPDQPLTEFPDFGVEWPDPRRLHLPAQWQSGARPEI